MPHDTTKLNEMAQAITRTMYDLAEHFGVERSDLADLLLLAAGNVGFAAYGAGCVEHMRTALDVFEAQLLAPASRST